MVIAIDLTPFQPNGINGGIGPLIISTIHELAKRDNEIVLLTNRANYQMLAFLDAEHISRQLVDDAEIPAEIAVKAEAGSEKLGKKLSVKDRMKQYGREKVLVYLPGVISWILLKCLHLLRRVKHIVFYIGKKLVAAGQKYLKERHSDEEKADVPPQKVELDRKVDVLFCPFSAVKFQIEGVPAVSQVNDIQHEYCPFYFPAEEYKARKKFYGNLVKTNPYICAISDYTRNSLIEKYQVDPMRVFTVYPAVQDRLSSYSETECSRVLIKNGLQKNAFAFFPANMWPHKNHRSLLTAFSMYSHRNPGDEMKLVLTGAGLGREKEFMEEVRQLGLEGRVIWLGYVKEIELAGLMRNCRYLIYPSFFEGFGLPVTEAMAAGVPVLCSNVTSLPEVGGDCVFYFNPYNPEEICNLMEYVRDHPQEVTDKIGQYPEQLSKFNLNHYLDSLIRVFEKAVRE